MPHIRIERHRVTDIDDHLRSDIDKFTEIYRGTVFHEITFNRIFSEVFGTRMTYFLAWSGDGLIGVCPCHTFKEGLIEHTYSSPTSFEIPYGGWIYNNKVISVQQLMSGMKLSPKEALHMSTNIEPPGMNSYDCLSRKTTMAHTVILDLAGKSVDSIFESFSHGQRNKIRKAEKLGVTIIPIGSNDFDSFQDLVIELKENVAMQIRDREYYERVFSEYHGLNRCCCLGAVYNGEIISTLILLANKAFTTIWIGGRKMGITKNLYQNELMIWEAIKWAKGFGSDYFDLCVINEEKYPNLARMKLSFSKEIWDYHYLNVISPAFKVLNRFNMVAYKK